MVTLAIILLIGFTTGGISFAYLSRLVKDPKAQEYVISADPHRRMDGDELNRIVRLNQLVSIVCIVGLTFGLYSWLFYTHEVPWWRHLLEALTVIFIYDFGYYFMHRFLFHEWSVLRKVHAVHHAANYPQSIDSLLLHPVETVMGLGLLTASILAVGGIHIYTFAPIFVMYTTYNVWNHAGINIPHGPMKIMGRIAVIHDKHHHSMRSGNYASLTPLPDLIFGTAQR